MYDERDGVPLHRQNIRDVPDDDSTHGDEDVSAGLIVRSNVRGSVDVNDNEYDT